jgi:hypothetical protein
MGPPAVPPAGRASGHSPEEADAALLGQSAANGIRHASGLLVACDCVPPYPETQAYVARILALLDGAGDLLGGPPALEVRLIA